MLHRSSFTIMMTFYVVCRTFHVGFYSYLHNLSSEHDLQMAGYVSVFMSMDHMAAPTFLSERV